MSDLRLEGTAEEGAVVAVFDDGRELVLVAWAGVKDPAETNLIDIDYSRVPANMNLTLQGYRERSA